MKLIDITGQRFGTLVALRRSERRGHWVCQCDCGREHVVRSGNLRRGFVRSCGCAKSALITAAITSHGMSGTPEYEAWCGMRNRCYKPQDGQYQNYGARGIRVCDEWRESFEAFFAHVGRRPSANHSIDRLENDGHYEPGNVRWATAAEQCRNTRCTKLTMEDAREIRRLRASKVPFAAIRKRFGISDALISNIQAGRAWKDDSSFAPAAAAGANCPSSHDPHATSGRNRATALSRVGDDGSAIAEGA